MKVGILNCSEISKRIIPAFQSIEGIEVTTICSRSIDKANKFALDFDIPYPTTNEEELYGLDVVYISSPPSEHYLSLMKFIDMGVHVLCEKSLTTSAEDTKKIIEMADDNGVIVQENYAFPFHNQWNYIVETLPELGDLLHINSGFEFPPRNKSIDFRYNAELGGGALLDAGGYPIKAASLLMDQLHLGEISGRERFSCDSEIDVSGDVYFVDESGISSLLSWSFESPYRCEIEIKGTKGKLSAKKIFTPKEDEMVWVDRMDEFGNLVSTKPFKDNHFANLIKDFKRRIEQNDNSHHIEIIKQSNWQSYAKTTSLRTLVN
jgi:NDP-hexose-3-ketoreductase